MYLYNDNFLVHTCEISKKKFKKICIRTEILTVEDLNRNVLSKKMCFHVHDYAIYIAIKLK